MSCPHSQNQLLQQPTKSPAPPPPEICETSTVPDGNPQGQQMGRQGPFRPARAEVFNQKNTGQFAENHTSDSGESSHAQPIIPFASSRKGGGKRVAGRWTCPVEDCPKGGGLVQK